jgi:heat shock protein HslJ
MRRPGFVLGAAVLPFFTGPATTPIAATLPLNGTAWALTTLGGRWPLGNERITLEFIAGRVQGTDGCNRYSGPYSAGSAQLRIGPEVAATQMGCPAPIMARAVSYMNVLLNARGYRIKGAELRLLGASNAVEATFAIQPRQGESAVE